MDPTSAMKSLSSIAFTDVIPFLVSLYRELRQVMRRESHEGLYEVLEYDAVLELVDPKGETAIFKKRQRVKFLQDYVLAFQDYVWGDGELYGDYSCSRGVVVD